MRLSKLTILGFKSFADRVALDFDASVIAVVGPNGCGKSNIVDAFRWVTGEQSAKSLRGDKMDDVLFAGASKRKPTNFAEVSVTFTECENLGVDLNEITLTRRLYRSGESEYLLNKETVRLKDIQSLLLGTGIGKNALSIFEQGKLDQVIYLNPQERRSIFDEAAGIGRFLQRKKESLRRLAEVSENYDKVKGVHTEVEGQVRLLKKQATEAKSFQEKKKRLEELEKALFIHRWRLLSKQIAEADLEKTARDQKAEVFKKGVQQSLNALGISKLAVDAKENEARRLKEAVYELTSQRKIEEASLARAAKENSELYAEESRLIKELEEFAVHRKSSLNFIRAAEERLSVLQKEKELLEKDLEKKKAAHLSSEVTLRQKREEIKVRQQESIALTREENRLASDLKEKELKDGIHEERLGQIGSLKESKKEALKLLADQKLEKKQKVDDLSSAIDLLKKEKADLEKKLEDLKKEIAFKHKEKDAHQHLNSEIRAKEKALLSLQEGMEGFSAGAKKLLTESKKQGSPLFGKVMPLASVLLAKVGLEKSLATVMRPYLETLIVKSQEDLESVLAYSLKEGLKGISVACVEDKHPSIESPLAEKSVLASFFLGDCSLSETLSRSGPSVTLEGHYIDAKGVIFLSGQEGSATNMFLRLSELKALQAELKEHETKRLELEKQLDILYRQRALLDERRKGIEDEARKKEMMLVQENFAYQRLIKDLEKEQSDLARLEEEYQKLSGMKQASKALIQTLGEQLARASVRAADAAKKLSVFEEEIDKELKALDAYLLALKAAEGAFAKILQAWQKERQDIALYEAKDEESQKGEKKNFERLGLIKQKLKDAGELSKTLAVSLKLKETAEADAAAHSKLADTHVKEAKNAHSLLEKKAQEAQKELTELEGAVHAASLQLAAKTSARDALFAECTERFQKNPETLATDIVETLVPESIEKEIRQLQVSLEKNQLVNLTAIEEYKTQEERFTMLDRELSDMMQAKQDLEKIISELAGESRKLFKTTFERIRGHFQKNFAILFGGGEADLKYTDESDVLESGIEIVARPPGKQMRSISLLSGGEKCLTALALLFSIFEERPAPFCILDEVDAPLDDSNIDRFTAILQQYIGKTQFIIVTHNKKTMSVADLLFGVSMEERGVSKVLSLMLSKKEADALSF